MKIIIGGPGGSGSSSVAKHVAETFHLEYVYGGEIMRRFSEQMGFGYENVLAFFESDVFKGGDWDRKVDKELERQFLESSNILIESKVFAGIATKKGLSADAKIWITADISARTRRVMAREFGIPVSAEIGQDDPRYVQVYNRLLRRFENDKRRFYDIYGVEYDKPELYNDWVFDTTDVPLNEVKDRVIAYIRKKHFS